GKRRGYNQGGGDGGGGGYGEDGGQDGGEGDRGAGETCQHRGEVVESVERERPHDKRSATPAGKDTPPGTPIAAPIPSTSSGQAMGHPTVRGTQSFVHTLSACWKRPSLTALEVLWRWAFGAPAAALITYEFLRVLRETRFEV